MVIHRKCPSSFSIPARRSARSPHCPSCSGIRITPFHVPGLVTTECAIRPRCCNEGNRSARNELEYLSLVTFRVFGIALDGGKAGSGI